MIKAKDLIKVLVNMDPNTEINRITPKGEVEWTRDCTQKPKDERPKDCECCLGGSFEGE